MKLFACDPGESIGYVSISYDLETKQMTILNTGVQKFGGSSKVTARFFRAQVDDAALYVVENYVINPKVYGHSHQGDSGIALRQIGMLEMLAVERDAQVILQMPTVKPPGYGYLGKQYVRGKKGQHAFDALAHVVFYLVTQLGMQPLQ